MHAAPSIFSYIYYHITLSDKNPPHSPIPCLSPSGTSDEEAKRALMTHHQDSLKPADNRTCPRFKSCHPESRHKNSPPAYAPGLFFRLRITGLEHIQNRKTILVAIIFSLRFGCQVPFTNISYHFRKRRKSDRIKTNPLSHRFRSEDESFYQFDKFKFS